jgi:hypothetical protein
MSEMTEKNPKNPLVKIAEAGRAYLGSHPDASKIRVTIYQPDDRYPDGQCKRMEFWIARESERDRESDNKLLNDLYAYTYCD